jgi:hypothetical protein
MSDKILREINGEFRFGDDGFTYLGKTFKYDCLDKLLQCLSENLGLRLRLGIILDEEKMDASETEISRIVVNMLETFHGKFHICPKCHVKFNRSDNLLRHFRNCHFCVKCNKNYNNSSNLLRHSWKCIS